MKSQQTLCLPALTNVCMHVPAVHCKLWHVQLLQHWECPFQQGIPAWPAGRSRLVLPPFRREVIGINGRVAGSAWWYNKKRSGGIAKRKPLSEQIHFKQGLPCSWLQLSLTSWVCVCLCTQACNIHSASNKSPWQLLTALLLVPLRLGKKPALCNSIKGRLSLVTTKNINGCLQVVVVSSHTWVCFSAVFSCSRHWLDSKIIHVVYYLSFWVSEL